MSQNTIDILNDEIKKINESRGTYLTNKIYQIQISLSALETNFNELRSSLINYSNPKISSKLWEVGHRDRTKKYMWNVSRLLQNYLSSAATFRDHLRFLTNIIFKDHDFIDEFKSKTMETFDEDPLSNFIMKFRNNYLHTCVAGTRASFNIDFDESKIRSAILLNKNQLLSTYKEWNSKSLDFINEMPDEVPLIKIVKEYFSKVLHYYQWYEKRFFKIFEKEFNELKELKEEFNQLQKKMFNIKS